MLLTVVLEKTLESPLDYKEIQPVHPKGDQAWVFIGRIDAEAPILWPLDTKSWLLGRKVMTNLNSILKSITLSAKVRLVKALVFPIVMCGYKSWTIKKAMHRRIDAFELWYWRSSWGSLGLQGDQTSPSWRRSVLGVHWKDWCWSWNCNPLATWCEEWTHLKRPWGSERVRAGGEGGDRGWDGWMASPTRWTWVWTNSRSWLWTGRPGMLQFIGSQRVRHD